MSVSKESDAGFPWFEEQNFTGWLVHFRAHLRKAGAHVVLDRSRPSDLDAQGNPIPMNAQKRCTFNDEVAEYDRLDNIAFSELMKACRQNVKMKNLSETGEVNTAFELLQRLRQRYHTVDDITKAKHMLNYHALTEVESESGAEFVDRELREYLALRDMGVQIDDSIRLTKFIQQDTTNTKHKQLTQTIFTTPNMTLGRAASLFETYNPPSGPAAVPTTPTVMQSFVATATEKTTNYQIVPRKSQFPIRRGLKNPIRLHLLSPDQLNARDSLAQSVTLWVPDSPVSSS